MWLSLIQCLEFCAEGVMFSQITIPLKFGWANVHASAWEGFHTQNDDQNSSMTDIAKTS